MGSLGAFVFAVALVGGAGHDNTVLLDFSADWCEPCKLMVPTMRRLEMEGLPVRRVNVDQFPRLVEHWKVGSIPCYILVRDGREVERVVGAASYDRLARMFEKSGHTRPAASSDRGWASANPTDAVRSRPNDGPDAATYRGQSPDPGLARRVVEAASDFAGDLGNAARGGSPEPERSDVPNPDGSVASGSPVHSPGNTSLSNDRSASSDGSMRADHGTDDAERRAAESSVRLRLEESNGHAFGTGTIIDVHGDEALVVTCGHLFRESNGQAAIRIELVGIGTGSESGGPFPGQLIAYDAGDRDIALVSFRPGTPVRPAPVAATVESIRSGEPVFGMGCDHGGPLSILRGRITTVDRYSGRQAYAHNIEVSGEPVDGRSGGGLFNLKGELIGVCNAADPADHEGIYAGLKTVHWQLAQVGQERVFQTRASGETPIASRDGEPPARSGSSSHPSPADAVGTSDADRVSRSDATSANLLQALESGAELICVVRNASGGDKVLVLDADSRELLERLARAQLAERPPSGTIRR
ncbi:MAG: trypsin-like serine protease [Planctomycetes bacterium]|nr:trypsin-like serine protease [Planctomycetota bacterium]